MRTTWWFIAGCALIGCDGGHAPPTETVIQTQGNKEEARLAVGSAAFLDSALQNQDLGEVERLAFSIGVLAGSVAIGSETGPGGTRTPFPEPVAPPQAAATGCDVNGCTFDHYWEQTLYAYLIDGVVRVQETAGTRSIDIALRASEGQGAALNPTMYVNGALQVTPTTVNGAVTLVTTYPDRREEPQSLRYQAVTFDPAADLSSTTPVSGSISAEWTTADYDTGVYTTLAATVQFP
jgi:hypothetical protein